MKQDNSKDGPVAAVAQIIEGGIPNTKPIKWQKKLKTELNLLKYMSRNSCQCYFFLSNLE